MPIWALVFEKIDDNNAVEITELIRKVVPNAELIDSRKISVLPISKPLSTSFKVLLLCNCENKPELLKSLEHALAGTPVVVRASI